MGATTDETNRYPVLPPEERAGHRQRVLRFSYWHIPCREITSIMSDAIAETFSVRPSFYATMWCAFCMTHRPCGPGGEFRWVDRHNPEVLSDHNPMVGT